MKHPKMSTHALLPAGQWGGGFTFHMGLFLGFLASTLASIVESIGDYNACARVAQVGTDRRWPILRLRALQVASPPAHAVNRGILTEGIGCFFSALLGGGTSLTTYSENVGAIGLTRVGVLTAMFHRHCLMSHQFKVASRRVLQTAGIILALSGICTKFGALLATIPEPMVGAQLAVSGAMVAGVSSSRAARARAQLLRLQVGLSSVQHVDMRVTRNVAVLGLACFAGIAVPQFVAKHPLRPAGSNSETSLLLAIQLVGYCRWRGLVRRCLETIA